LSNVFVHGDDFFHTGN
jgi:hypothetical protein